MTIPGFEEESAEDKAFWENPSGPPPAPAGVDPDEFQASITESETAAEEGAPEPATEEPPAEEAGQADDEGDGAEGSGGKAGSAPETAQEVADLAARLAAYEKRLADKDEFINRQANELGSLRQRAGQIEQQANMGDWEEVMLENPARAAQQALDAGDRRRYLQAREAWEEISPGAAANFEQNITLQQELEQLKQQLYYSTAPLYEQQELSQVANAYAQVKEKYPNFDDLEGEMGQILNTRPLMKESLQSVLRNGTPADQESALEDLYVLAAGRKRDTLSDAAKEAKANLDATAQEQRHAATVVTGGASPETPGQSIADKIGAEWDELASPYEDGWQV